MALQCNQPSWDRVGTKKQFNVGPVICTRGFVPPHVHNDLLIMHFNSISISIFAFLFLMTDKNNRFKSELLPALP